MILGWEMGGRRVSERRDRDGMGGVYGRLLSSQQEAEVLGCPEPQARASVIVDSQRHPRLPLSGGACGG